MKVKYCIPYIEFERGEIELNETEEYYFKKSWYKEAINNIADRIHLDAFQVESALETGYAYLEEVKNVDCKV